MIIGGAYIFTNSLNMPTFQSFNPNWGSFGGSGIQFGTQGLLGGLGGIGTYGFTGGWGIPREGWDPVLKKVLAGILTTVGYGDYETGVLDRPVASVPVVLHPEVLSRVPTIPNEEPEFIGIYGPQPPTDWEEVYRQYEILNPPEEEMAHDWGHLVRQGIETFTGIGMAAPQQLVGGPAAGFVDPGSLGGGGVIVPPGGGGALCPPAGSCGGPRYLTYDCRTGTMSVRRRRRRRALLTEGDKRDLGVIVAMFGKGAAAQIALAAAVKR